MDRVSNRVDSKFVLELMSGRRKREQSVASQDLDGTSKSTKKPRATPTTDKKRGRSKGKKPINKDRDIVWPEYFDDVCPPFILNE